jgi:hypothetical protein
MSEPPSAQTQVQGYTARGLVGRAQGEVTEISRAGSLYMKVHVVHVVAISLVARARGECRLTMAMAQTDGGVLSDAVHADCAHMHACVREAPQLCDDERRDCTRQSLITNPNPDNIKPTRPHASTPWALESVHVSMAHLRVYPCRYRSGVMSETILVFNGDVVSYQTPPSST